MYSISYKKCGLPSCNISIHLIPLDFLLNKQISRDIAEFQTINHLELGKGSIVIHLIKMRRVSGTSSILHFPDQMTIKE